MKNKILSSVALSILFLFINLVFFKRNFFGNDNFDNRYVFVFVAISIVIVILLLLLDKVKIEKKVVTLFVFFSMMYVFLIPFGYNPDEETHFSRALEVANGTLLSKYDEETGTVGRFESKSFYEDTKFKSYDFIKEEFATPRNEEKTFHNYLTAAVYPFFNYLPQSIGIMVGNLFSLSAMATIYLSKIINILIMACLLYYGFKLIGPFKNFFILLLFLPQTLQLAAATTVDFFTIVMVFLLVALVMNIRNNEKVISTTKLIVLVVLTFLVAMSKIVYLPIIFIVFLIPRDRFVSNRFKLVFQLSLVGIASLISLGWIGFTMSHFLSTPSHNGVDSPGQVLYVLHEPWMYIKNLFNTFTKYYGNYLHNIVHSDVVNGNVMKNNIFTEILLVLMMFSLFNNKSKKFNLKVNLWSSLIFIGVILLIMTSLYVQWTPLYYPLVEGVQGRYFIPLLFILPFVINGLNLKIPVLDSRYFLIIMIFINIANATGYFMEFKFLFG